MPALSFDLAPQSICLLRLSAIGDVTHMLPVIATLQNHWPDTRITWIIGRIEYNLVKSLDGIEFIVFDKKNGFKELLTLRKKLSGKSFDVLLMMQVALRANLISLLIKARVKIGYDQSRARDFHGWFVNQRIEGPSRVHVLDTFFQFIEKLGIPERKMDWLIHPGKEDLAFADNQIQNRVTVIINPCSSIRKNNYRNWPVENYAKVIDHLIQQEKYQIILTGGPAPEEKAFAEQIINLCHHSVINLVGKTSLHQLLALMQQAKFIIAPDTGPAHIGTVAGSPVVGLFASSNPLRTGPYNSQDILINAYPKALQKYSGLNIDEAKWGQRVREPEVMSLITVDDLISHLPGSSD